MTSQDPSLSPPAAKPTPKWQRWLSIIVGLVILGVSALRLITYFTNGDDLPACDSQRAKDSLSNVFKEKQLNPTSYSEIKTISSTKDLVECEATLPAGDVGILNVKYKFLRNGTDQRIEYTITATKPQQ